MAREIPQIQPTDSHRRSARHVLRAMRSGALATTLVADGGPYASFVTYATDPAGYPLLLLSELSNHTQNLATESRCSLLVVDGGLSNPQTAARVSVQAVAEKIPAGEGRDRLMARFLAIHPAASLYAGFGDFALWRLQPTAAHWIGGFARAVWLGADFVLSEEAVAAFERSQAETLVAIDGAAAARALGLTDEHWRIVSADADGVDITTGDGDASPRRWAF